MYEPVDTCDGCLACSRPENWTTCCAACHCCPIEDRCTDCRAAAARETGAGQ